MSSKRKPPSAGEGKAEVDAFLAALSHPHKPALEALRALILASDPRVSEGIKWNAPSFRLDDWFATMNLHGARLRLVLHLGAKPGGGDARAAIGDPDGLLRWLGIDRALVEFSGPEAFAAQEAALRRILRAWLDFIG